MKKILKLILFISLFVFSSNNFSLAYYNDGYRGPESYSNPNSYYKVEKIGLCLYIFQQYGKYGIIEELHETDTTKGSNKVIVSPIYDDIKVLNSKYIKVRLNGKYGVREYYDTRPTYNHLVVPIEWDDIDGLASEEFRVKRDNKYGVVNSKNQVLIPVEMDDIFQLSPAYCYAYLKNSYYGLINISFKIVTDPFLTYVDGIDKYTATGCAETGCGIWNIGGEELFPPVYDWTFVERPSDLPEGYFLTAKEGNYGLMDIEERILLDAKYPYIKSIKPYGAEIQTNVNGNKYNALVDLRTGNYVAQLIYDKIEYWEKYGYYKVKKNSKWGVINAQGRIVYPFSYGPLEINRMIKKHPVDNAQIQYVTENEFNIMCLEAIYYIEVNDLKKAKKILKKLMDKKYDKVYDIIYEYNIDPIL